MEGPELDLCKCAHMYATAGSVIMVSVSFYSCPYDHKLLLNGQKSETTVYIKKCIIYYGYHKYVLSTFGD